MEPSPDLIRRLPLAEAVLLLWRFAAGEARLTSIWDRFRGAAYRKAISFPILVGLIRDALLKHDGSARRSFDKSEERGELPRTVSAAYKKLARLPIPVSRAFLAECTSALAGVFPEIAQRELPASLRGFRPCILDGKAIKDVAKRLKPLRGLTAGLLGGKALVALDWKTGLAVAMHADPDGDANEIRLVEDLMPEVRSRLAGPRLFVADRAYCDLVQPARFTEAEGDHFVVRYHPKTPFARDPDPSKPVRSGTDERGRAFEEDWGWLGSESNPRRRRLRRITLKRASDAIVLLTDLDDADLYPAADLLWLYAERVGIEYLFQQVTEVFGLQRLIGTSPRACLFQFAFCLLLYNAMQVARAYVAEGRMREQAERSAKEAIPATADAQAKKKPEKMTVDRISAEKLFDDIKGQLMAWHIVIDAATTEAYFEAEPTWAGIVAKLKRLLGRSWSKTWTKAPARRDRPKTPKKKTKTHGSVHRILQEHPRTGKPDES